MDELDVLAQGFEVPGAEIEPVDGDKAARRLPQAEDDIQQRTRARAVRSGDAGARAGPDVKAPLGKKRRSIQVAKGKPLGDHLRAALAALGLLAVFALDWQIDDVAELVHRGHRVVPRLEFLPELCERGDDGAQDEFARDELAERDLLADDEPSADTEQPGRGEYLEGEQPGDLPHEDAEVGGARRDVFGCELVGLFVGHGVPAGSLEEQGKVRDLLEPVHEVILHPRFLDAGLHRAASANPQDDHDEHQQHRREQQQDRMVKRQQQHADESAQDEIHAIEQEQCGAFLHGDHIEKAVHQFGRVDVVECLGLHPRQPVREVRGCAHEDAPLDDVGDVVLEAIDDGLQRQAREERDGEHDEGLQIRRLLAAEREIAHDGIHRERHGQIQDSREDGENEQRPHVLLFGAEESEEPLHGTGVGVFTAVRTMVAVRTHPVRRPLGLNDAGFDDVVDSTEAEHFREF